MSKLPTEVQNHMEHLDKLVRDAWDSLSKSQAIIQSLTNDADVPTIIDESSIDRARSLQLLLQYRLDCQDALHNVLRVEHGLLQVLGISPHHSSKINLERIAYAIGQDDVKHMLHTFSDLIDALLKIANRHKKLSDKLQKRRSRQHHIASSAYSKQFNKQLNKAIELQKKFIALSLLIKNDLDSLNKYCAYGPVLDHTAALRGPISQFHQALENGLAQSNELYKTINQDISLNHSIGHLLEKANQVLEAMPPAYQTQPQLFHQDKTPTLQALDDRAAKRRLGHFFQY